ncbi:hypothetical protein ABT77_11875 [Salmonella enterica subsp. enterica serovar Typhimurium]|nr:hypothetical protein ABT77_11875 [Salmonella enterica subsp. enterica serovar Typhimurium]
MRKKMPPVADTRRSHQCASVQRTNQLEPRNVRRNPFSAPLRRLAAKAAVKSLELDAAPNLP